MTTAIAYTSGKPHIGNTYEIVLADAIARYKRAEGYDVYFQTGTDEHGQKIQEKAEAAGITPKEFVDGVAGEVKAIWDLMNTSYDNFVRTTDADHEKCVKKIFKKLYDQGDIYKGYYEGLYCTPCESFFTESCIIGSRCLRARAFGASRCMIVVSFRAGVTVDCAYTSIPAICKKQRSRVLISN